jgi:glycosyltransferase involved in cell wall biosynthesis
MAMNDITVCIPTIPPRADYLERALTSVARQTRPPVHIIIDTDVNREGPAALRNRMLHQVSTEYVAFLDDDDEMLPKHLELLWNCAQVTDADLVYPWFTVVQGDVETDLDPLGAFGLPFDPARLDHSNYIPVTVLARAEIVRCAGGFVNRAEPPATTCEDWGCWLRMRDAGAKFVHLPQRTWYWHWHGRNTSGRNDNW